MAEKFDLIYQWNVISNSKCDVRLDKILLLQGELSNF